MISKVCGGGYSCGSPSPIPSNIPSFAPSLVPTFILTDLGQKNTNQGSYKISMTGDVDVNFDESNSSEEIKFFLNISEAQVDELWPISVHRHDDCNNISIPTNVLNATVNQDSAVSIDTSPGFKKVEVVVDAKIDNIVNNDDIFEYKTDSNNEIAYLTFCVASNLGNITLYNDGGVSSYTSISYVHIMFNITISLSQGFQATSTKITELSPEDFEESATVNYDVLSCECVPSSKVCLSNDEILPYNQNSELNICVFTLDDEDDIQIR